MANRKFIDWLVPIILVVNLLVANLGLYNYRTSIPALVGIFAMGVFFLLNKKHWVANKQNKLGLICLLIIGVLYGIYGVIYRVPTYITYLATFAFVIPVLVAKMPKEVYKRFVWNTCNAFIVMIALYILASLIFVPLTSKAYTGIFNNPNLLGEMLSFSTVVCVYVLHNTESRKYRVFLYVLLGFIGALSFFTRSRTTILAIGLVMLAYLIFNLRKDAGSWKLLLKRMTCMAVAVGILGTTSFYFLTHVTPHISFIDFTKNEEAKVTGDEILKDTSDKMMKGLAGHEGNFSSGRTEIWEVYLQNIGVLGHDGQNLYISMYNGEPYIQNAHNTFLQVAYQIGWPGAIVFIILFLKIAISLLRKLIKGGIKDGDVFIAMIFANAFTLMMLATIISPFASGTMFTFWIILLPYHQDYGRND